MRRCMNSEQKARRSDDRDPVSAAGIIHPIRGWASPLCMWRDLPDGLNESNRWGGEVVTLVGDTGC